LIFSAASKTVHVDDRKIPGSYCDDNEHSIREDNGHERQKLDMGKVFFTYEVIFKVKLPSVPKNLRKATK
jgi:hypothetical protein